MNPLGLSSACYYPLVTEEAFEKICLSGAKYAEIFFNSPSELEKEFIREMAAMQRAFGVDIVSVHPFMSFAEDFFLFSPYERRFTDTLPLYERFFEVCDTLGAKIFVIHGARIPGASSDEMYCERFAKLMDLGKTYGVSVCQENVVRYRSESPAYLKMMREALGEDFGVVLDVHISDYRADCDCAPPLAGLFDFAEFFDTMKRIGYDGVYIIELYEHSYRDRREIVESYQKVKDLLIE